MNINSTPDYLDRSYELVFPPPFVADDVAFYGFILEADSARLRTICDRYLNGPLGKEGAFTPVGGFVLLACCGLPSLRSTAPGYEDKGDYAENEVAVWLPVIDHERERMLWMFPYIWVDNPFAMAMGREIYGFPKGLGEIEIASDPKTADHFSLKTLGVHRFAPGAKGEMLPLLDVRRVHDKGVGAVVDELFDDLGAMMKTMVHQLDNVHNLLGDLKLMLHTIEDMIGMKMPMVFLKEFRDAVDPTRVAYRSVIETMPGATKVHGGRLYGDPFDITILDCDSAPILRDLGLSTDGPIRSKLSFYMNFDFEIGVGTEITSSHRVAEQA